MNLRFLKTLAGTVCQDSRSKRFTRLFRIKLSSLNKLSLDLAASLYPVGAVLFGECECLKLAQCKKLTNVCSGDVLAQGGEKDIRT